MRSLGTKKIFMLKIKQRQLKYLGHITRNDGLENLTFTGYIESKRDNGSHLPDELVRMYGGT